MKELHLIVWLIQFGVSIVAPLAGFIVLALWLQQQYDLGPWIRWVGVGLGIASAVDGFFHSVKLLKRMSKDRKPTEKPPVSFNEHD